MKKRIVSILMAVVMIVGILPLSTITAFAEDLEGAKADAIKAIHDTVDHSDDAVLKLLEENAENAIQSAGTVAEVIVARDYWLTAINKQLGTSTHTHTFADTYTYNDTHHWRVCTCENATCEHLVVSDFGEHSFDDGVVNGNYTVFTCSECDYRKVIYNTSEDTEGEVIGGTTYTGISLTLGSDISINFYMDLSEDARQNGKMTFNIGGRIVTVDGKDAKYNETEKKYYFQTPLTALEMAEIVTATFTFNGIDYVQKYSVVDYIAEIVDPANNYDEEAVALAKKIANYGYFAQIYLASIHTNVKIVESGEGYDRMIDLWADDISVATAKEALKNYTVQIDGTSDNLSFYGSTVYFDSATALNYYVKVANGEMPNATCNGKTVTVTEHKGYKPTANEKVYIISVKDITATELADNIAVKINNELTITGSVFAYCNSVVKAHNFEGATENDTFAVNAMAAFYEYYESAMEYISFELHFDLPEHYQLFTEDGEKITEETTIKCYKPFRFRLVSDEDYEITTVFSEDYVEMDTNGLYTVSFVGGKHDVVVYAEIKTVCLTVTVNGEDTPTIPNTKVSFEYGADTVEGHALTNGVYTIDVPKGVKGTIIVKKDGYKEYREEFTADGSTDKITVDLIPND